MLNLKKTAVAVLAFSSSAVFAGTMGPVCAPGAVTVPCEATAWDFGGQALYLQAARGADDSYFGYHTDTANPNSHTFNNLGSTWGWGFQIEGSYHFNTGNDLDVNWYHLGNNHRGTFTNNFTEASTATLNQLEFKPQWDAVNIEFGQHVDFSEAKKIRFHGGAQFGRIKSTFEDGRYTTADALYAYGEQNRTFNGFGPRVGIDMAYNWGNGFAMYAKGATTLLIGTGKFSSSSYLTKSPTTVYSWNGSSTMMVPELEGKLGVKYDYALASGDLTLDVGYMWLNYFNAEHGLIGNAAVLPNLVSEVVHSNDFALDGVYFGAKWTGNVA